MLSIIIVLLTVVQIGRVFSKSAADSIRVFDIYLVFQEQVSFPRVMLNLVQHLTKQGHLRP